MLNIDVSEFLVRRAPVPPTIGVLGGGAESPSKQREHDLLFIGAITLYLNHLNTLILDSLHRLAEAQRNLAREARKNQKIREKHRAQEKWEEKQREILHKGQSLRICRYYEGELFNAYLDYRHLHTAV